MEGENLVITVVCTGNICRSPMAEHLLRHALDGLKEDLPKITVGSAGVSAFPGDPASPNAVKAMKKVGLDLSGHRSSRLTPERIAVSDLILTMTQSHKDIIELTNPDLSVPIFRFREWVGEGSREVPDPFGGSLGTYLETRDSIAEAIPSVLKYLKNKFTQ